MRRRLSLLLVLLLLLVSGCASGQPSQPPVPTLTPVKAKHFTISIPEGWKLLGESESGDQVSFSDPKEPESGIVVFTLLIPEAGKAHMERRWQFADRNPVPFQGEAGREGLSAEGPRSTEPTKQILAVGYWEEGRWDMFAEAIAPKVQFDSKRPLFTAILKTLKPDPNIQR